MDVWMEAGTSVDPAELFTRFNSWSSYVAIKWGTQGDAATGIIEVPGGSLTGVNIPLSTVFNIEMQYTASGGTASAVDVLIDNVNVGQITGLSIDVASGSNIEIRSQKVQSYVDNVVPRSWPGLFLWIKIRGFEL